MRNIVLVATLFSAVTSRAAEPPDPLLARLEGPWKATGQVRGKPVTYDAEGRWVLGGAFLELSLRDVATPPQYEARVLLGRSKSKGDYIAHWLDGFGADGARVVGVGTGSADSLVLTFPYDKQPFRDRFELARDGTFTLVIDSQSKDGFSRFADYRFVRPGDDAVKAAIADVDAARAATARARGEEKALMDADLAFAKDALDRHVSDAFADRFLADGKIFPAKEPVVVGAEAVRTALKDSRAKWHWAPVEARVSGDLGVTWGIAALTYERGGALQVHRTRYVTVWRKQAGAWRIWLDIGSEGPPLLPRAQP